ncbi:MAG: COX15/CtaA family protein [Chloroflexota bacterium]
MKPTRFANYCWFVLAYTLGVILWGAFVRATGAGAGCGSHWPTCHGQIIPRPEEIETVIEFTHRLTSAFLGVLIIIMVVWAFRRYGPGHIVRKGAVLSLIFVIIEGALGAGLVLLELVGLNQSVERAVAMALHLVNTLILVGFLTLTAWWASGGRLPQWPGQARINWLLGIGVVGLLVVGASGAVTALGDTLFVHEGVQIDASPTTQFLVQLRIWHPALAVVTGLFIVLASTAVYRLRPSSHTQQFSRLVKATFVVQLFAGVLNVYLMVPVWMQLVHLLLADLIWIAWILLGATALAEPARQPAVVTGDGYSVSRP